MDTGTCKQRIKGYYEHSFNTVGVQTSITIVAYDTTLFLMFLASPLNQFASTSGAHDYYVRELMII